MSPGHGLPAVHTLVAPVSAPKAAITGDALSLAQPPGEEGVPESPPLHSRGPCPVPSLPS